MCPARVASAGIPSIISKDATDVAICEFSYRAKSWQRSRTLKAMRSVKEYVEVSYLGEKTMVPVYQYMCMPE